MDANVEMQQVWHSFRRLQSRAVKILKREFTDLYAVSSRAFGSGAPGDASHHIRLGEFLIEWNKALETCPVEAIALGRQAEVLCELAKRTDLSEAACAATRVGNGTRSSVQPHDFASGGALHIAYCNYAATGEGLTVMIAMSGSAEYAKTLFEKNTPDFFRRGMEVKSVADTSSADVAAILRWVPQAVMDRIKTTPAGTSGYYGTFHVNLS